MVTKIELLFLRVMLKKIYGNKRFSHFFRESFLTYLKLDIYKCPIFKFTKNFPEKKEYEKYENLDF